MRRPGVSRRLLRNLLNHRTGSLRWHLNHRRRRVGREAAGVSRRLLRNLLNHRTGSLRSYLNHLTRLAALARHHRRA